MGYGSRVLRHLRCNDNIGRKVYWLSIVKIPYKGEAFKTYDKLFGNMSSTIPNTVYCYSDSQPIYFYRNKKNYIHILMISDYPFKRGYYHINDYMLSRENTLVYKDSLNIVCPTKNEAIQDLKGLVGKVL